MKNKVKRIHKRKRGGCPNRNGWGPIKVRFYFNVGRGQAHKPDLEKAKTLKWQGKGTQLNLSLEGGGFCSSDLLDGR